MRTVGQLPNGIPKEVSANFPDGTVIDETVNIDGTPVVREIYGDVLVNIYKVLRAAGVIPNGLEDSEATSYQFLAALQRLANVQNDIEQTLTLVGSVFSIGLAIENLPNKYFILARSTGKFIPGNSYTFKGTGAQTYSLIAPAGFNIDDEILLILDTTGVRAFSFGAGTAATIDTLFSVFGTPAAFSDSSKLWYQSQGLIFSDLPEIYDLQSLIRVAASDGTIIVYEILIISGHALCLTLIPSTLHYNFWSFDTSNLATAPVLMTTSSPNFPTGTVTNDYQPFIFTDGLTLWISNNSGASVNDYAFNSYVIDFGANTVTGSGSIGLDNTFVKTTNSAIKNNYLYIFVAGIVKQYNLGTGEYKYGAAFPGFIGNIFNYKGDIYYSNGEVSKKWALPVYT